MDEERASSCDAFIKAERTVCSTISLAVLSGRAVQISSSRSVNQRPEGSAEHTCPLTHTSFWGVLENLGRSNQSRIIPVWSSDGETLLVVLRKCEGKKVCSWISGLFWAASASASASVLIRLFRVGTELRSRRRGCRGLFQLPARLFQLSDRVIKLLWISMTMR